MSQLSEFVSQHHHQNVEELKELLRIPSISSLTEHKEDIQKAASWIANKLKTIGMEHVEIVQTKGHPIIYADWLHQENAPTVLVYGHYDVQPVDPIHLWETPPFEPDIRDEKIFARGATDDKGQTFLHIKAVETLLKVENKLPVNLKFCIEGEEEIGSPHLPQFLSENKEKLAYDVVVISDSDMWDRGVPAITYSFQNPEKIQGLIKKHLEEKAPKGCTVKVTLQDTGNPFLTPIDDPMIQKAAEAYEQVFGKAPVYKREGGSIPIVSDFSHTLNSPVVLMGFGLPDENLHAPNEHFNLENFDKGILTICSFLDLI